MAKGKDAKKADKKKPEKNKVEAERRKLRALTVQRSCRLFASVQVPHLVRGPASVLYLLVHKLVQEHKPQTLYT